MPNAMRRPGSTRVVQSKTSKGTNGSPATLHAKKRIPISAAVSMADAKRALKNPADRETFINDIFRYSLSLNLLF